jgi:GDPmannose 4,6-dehydratase
MYKNFKAIIFGVNGQDGFYLSELLITKGINVIGVSRSNSNYLIGDVADRNFVEQLIKVNQPEYVFHLAANSTTSHEMLFENFDTITAGTLNILEAVYEYSKHSKVFISGSCLQFVNHNLPIIEDDAFEARDSYSMARIQSVYTARYYRKLGIKVYVGYFFHHDSPYRKDRHLNMKIIKTALKIKDGTKENIEIGKTSIIKEFNHAADLMNAIWILIAQNKIFEAVIGSGEGHSIAEWINTCFEIIGIEDQNCVKQDKTYIPDFISMVANPQTIKSLGWQPSYSMYDLAKAMVDVNI